MLVLLNFWFQRHFAKLKELSLAQLGLGAKRIDSVIKWVKRVLAGSSDAVERALSEIHGLCWELFATKDFKLLRVHLGFIMSGVYVFSVQLAGRRQTIFGTLIFAQPLKSFSINLCLLSTQHLVGVKHRMANVCLIAQACLLEKILEELTQLSYLFHLCLMDSALNQAQCKVVVACLQAWLQVRPNAAERIVVRLSIQVHVSDVVWHFFV